MNCYVGEWNDRPIGIAVVPNPQELNLAHPRDFKNIVPALEVDIWTNNAQIVNFFPPENVLVCKNGKTKRLTEHPKWNVWKDEFYPGEFWSVMGEDWVCKS